MLTFEGVLTIEVDGIPARFEAEEGALRLDMEDPVAFLRASQLLHTSNLGVMRFVSEQLVQQGLTLTIVSKGKTLVVMGNEVKGNMASSLLGVPHLDVRGSALISLITG